MNWTDRRTRFRAVLNGDRCVHPGSVYDAISARIAEDIGFELGMFAGSIGSMAVLGAPDLIVLTLSEFADQAYRINRAGNLALMVDADHGYGNALNVRRTVEELETAGIAGMSIEDTDLPTPHGTTKPRLISIAEGVGGVGLSVEGEADRKRLEKLVSLSQTPTQDRVIPPGGLPKDVGTVVMKGKEVFRHAVVNLAQVMTEVLDAAGYVAEDVDWVVPHQANKRILDATAKKLGLPPEKVIVTVDRHANTSAASVPLALDESVRAGKITALSKRAPAAGTSVMGRSRSWRKRRRSP